MNTSYSSLPGLRPADSEQVLDQKIGDVTGDSVPDTVILTGRVTADSPYITGITLVVHSWGDRRTFRVQPENNAGYQPTLFLGDFTGDKVDDILIRIDTGGSGATTFDYLYTFAGGQMNLIFDSEKYNQMWNYTVDYLDNYLLRVSSPGADKTYTVNIASRGEEYLNQIYNPNGTLKKPVQGFTDPLSGLYPIDLDRDGTYELMALQGVSGLYHADRFGYMTNLLKWNKGTWELVQQWFAFLG
ncbi:VCBS repeat-containing protein [Paenibacillus sp. J22TS3]|uniref:VCBS repeat-containing protein n=1 Tax=Paenibacillus sp. J22TS3 TaxID=2807192 RepID=UPI001B108B11|nr:VCBS repeat-containing protein [Paenibacillus sp. J22TS3]GIP21698.1 hypothetical protein J22TS3_19730 [Paenibacillus sp. J22TS3]